MTWCWLSSATTNTQAAEPSFTADIAPLLVKHCVACHGPKNPQGEYQLHNWQRTTIPGSSTEPPFVPGKPDQGEWLRLITHQDPNERMPKDRPALSAEQIKLIQAWIAAGAKYDHPDPQALLLLIAKREAAPVAPRTYAQAIPIRAAVVLEKPSQILVGGYYEATAWSLEQGQLLTRYPGLPQRTLSMSLHPDQQHLAVAGGEPGSWGEVLVYDLSARKVIAQLAVATEVFTSVDWSHSGQQLAAGGTDRSLTVWNWPARTQQFTIEAHADWVHSVRWSRDEQHLLTASRDKTARIFAAKDGQLLASFTDDDQAIMAAEYAPGEQFVLSGGLDRVVWEWSAKDGQKFKPKSKKEPPPDPVKDRAAIVASRANPFGKGGIIQALAVNQHKVLVAQGTEIRGWEYETRQPLQTWTGAAGTILWLSTDDKQARIVAGDQAGQITIWNWDQATPLREFIAKPNE